MLPLLLLSTVQAEEPESDLVSESDLVYFVLVDRFDNGDATNDDTIDLADPHAFHGGDLAGVTRRLPYLYDLGVRTIWLSPVFTMRTEKFHSHGAFHGYWIEDLGSIEPRFGGDEALIALADAVEEAGIRLILDMVYNHTSFDAPLVTQRPDWFHSDGSIENWDDPVELINGQVHGLPDLAQENPEVYEYLLRHSLHWGRTLSADGFRIDAVRHMPNDFFHSLSTDLKEELGADFWLLGEDFQGDPVQLSSTFRDGGFDAMFDFPLRYALVDVICHGTHPGRLASTLSADHLYDDPAGLVTFLDNHDLPRLASECGGERWRVEAALMALFALRGTPSITYGTEWMLDGPGEPENRADMPWQTRGPLADTLATLAALRAEHPFLTDAEIRIGSLEDDRLELWLLGKSQSARLILNLGTRPLTTEGAGVLVGEGGTLREFEGTVPSRSAALLFSSSTHLPWPDETVSVHIDVQAKRRRGEQLVVVGAGEALGDWDPARGIPLPASIKQPLGSVMAYKLVRIDRKGVAHWEERENRYAVVGEEDMRIEALWEEKH
ncbi:MAG: hypothetical protein ACI8RZ_000012 [Myxococcota bacterium]|jgi:hypothetical protein